MKAAADDLQRRYYAETATDYERLHVVKNDEHYFALAWMLACIDHLDCQSVLDVGSGTGRAVSYLRQRRPAVRVVGIEPSAELRAVGHRQGVPVDQLVDGDAMRLGFDARAFDLVCEFGVLHHLAHPSAAVAEMSRVARLAVFISDDNHFGSGSATARRIKRILGSLGLWRTAYLLRTGGKGYRVTAGDGLAYPYSVFDDLPMLESTCSVVHCLNTRGRGPDLRTGSSHVALLGVKRNAG